MDPQFVFGDSQRKGNRHSGQDEGEYLQKERQDYRSPKYSVRYEKLQCPIAHEKHLKTTTKFIITVYRVHSHMEST